MRLPLLLSSACSVFLIVPITAAFFTGVLPLSPNQQHREQLLGEMNAFLTEKLEHAYGADEDSFDHPEAEFQPSAKFGWLCHCEHPEEEFDWLCHTLSFHLASKSFVTRKVYGYPPTAGHGINDCIFAYRAQHDEKACNTLQNLIEHYDRKYNTWYPQELEKNITAQKELIAVGSSSLENNQNKLRRLLERKLTFSTFCSDADTVRAEQFTKAYLQYYEPEEAA